MNEWESQVQKWAPCGENDLDRSMVLLFELSRIGLSICIIPLGKEIVKRATKKREHVLKAFKRVDYLVIDHTHTNLNNIFLMSNKFNQLKPMIFINGYIQ